MGRALVTCLLVLAGSARAQGDLDALRAALKQAEDNVRLLSVRQAAVRAELDRASATARTLKAQGRPGRGEALTRALRASQDLSAELEAFARALSQAQATAQARGAALDAALTDALAKVRAAWDRAHSSAERGAVVAQLRALKAERARVRQGLQGPAPALPKVETGSGSDDPDELLEQADALRDEEDKARAQLKAVETRLAEAQEESALEQRMGAFQSNEDLMDEQTRDLKVTRSAAGTPSSGSGSVGITLVTPVTGGTRMAGSATGSTSSVQAEDARPQVELDKSALSTPLPDDLRSLSARARELKGLVDELERRAKAAEARARALK